MNPLLIKDSSLLGRRFGEKLKFTDLLSLKRPELQEHVPLVTAVITDLKSLDQDKTGIKKKKNLFTK